MQSVLENKNTLFIQDNIAAKEILESKPFNFKLSNQLIQLPINIKNEY